MGRCETRSTISCTLASSIPMNACPGVHVVRARLEREPLVAEPPERLDDQRRLADAWLADDQDRPRAR